MVHERRDIKDRVATGDDCFYLQELPDGRIKLVPAPDSILEVGTDINKALLQPIEDDLILQNLYNEEIKGYNQYPTYSGENIIKIEHKDINNVVVRTDTFSYAPDLITETRTLSTGETLTLKYYFDPTNGTYLRTEVE